MTKRITIISKNCWKETWRGERKLKKHLTRWGQERQWVASCRLFYLSDQNPLLPYTLRAFFKPRFFRVNEASSMRGKLPKSDPSWGDTLKNRLQRWCFGEVSSGIRLCGKDGFESLSRCAFTEKRMNALILRHVKAYFFCSEIYSR